uniref:Uncharacterized protein n=1 Tax=Ciona savignyi TaxID=51511 RepID=H2YIH1_CIOSA
MAVYTGPNAPSATIQVPDVSPTNYLQAFNFGLTSCNGQAIVSMINQFRDRNSALLKTNISTSINMWPFVSEVGISKLLSPIWPCEMCLGEIEGELVFDATNPSSKQASIHIMTSRTSLWTMSYSMGTRPDQASFVSASTEWQANVGRTTAPHILFSTTVETLQGRRYMLQTRALSQNMGAYSGCLNETFSQVVGQRLQNEIEIQSEILSLKNLLIWGNDESRIMLRTPNTEAASLGMDITFHGDEM